MPASQPATHTTPSGTSELIRCDECYEEIEPGDAVARDADDAAPWLCPDCARFCDACGDLIAWDEAVARDGDSAAPWLCEECAPCKVCGEPLGTEVVARDADDQAPWIHRDCARWCNTCGDLIAWDEAVALDDDGRAPWIHKECAPCLACGEPLGTGDLVARDADDRAPWIHRDCARYCDRCSELIAWDEAVALDGDDQAPWLCPDCADSDEDCYEAPHGYDFRPDPVFFGTDDDEVPGTPYLGMELEIEANSYADREGIIDATEGSDDLFYCKSDGSLGDHGVEVVTHPMTIGYAQAFDWATLCGTLAARGSSWATETCGIHVHLSRDSMKRSHLWRFARLLNGNALEFGKLAGRFSSKWARFADDDFAPVSKAIAGKAPNPSRYSALNLENEATVEVRIFRGTLKPSGVLANIELVHAMWAYTAALSFAAVRDGALDFDAFRAWVEIEASGTYPALVERMAARLGSSTTLAAVAA